MRSDRITGSLPENIIVFGTGFVSRVFMKALESAGISGRVSLFLESELSGRESFMGRPVIPVGSFYKDGGIHSDGKIFIAVHEVSLPEAEKALKDNGLSGEWVYPFLHELLFGPPLFERTEVKTEHIIAQQPRDEYWLAVRFSGLLAHCGEDEGGRKIYKKAMALSSSERTAEKRFARFGELINDIRINGFDPERPVVLDEDLRIIDGLHRIAVAAYLGTGTMQCRIFERSPIYEKVIDEKMRVSENILNSGVFTEWEIGKIKEYRKYLS